MNISYQNVSNWFKSNFKLLLVLEVVCVLIAGIYFVISPRVYEANFSVGLPKVPNLPITDSPTPKMRLLISPQEFIRPTQDPMAYSSSFMQQCMGEDTNASRKQFINALQLGVKQQGDVIAFTLRLSGKQRTQDCANLMLIKVLSDLSITQENYLKSANLSFNENIAKPSLILHVRMSDSYVKPDLVKLMTAALVGGILISLFLTMMRKRYSA